MCFDYCYCSNVHQAQAKQLASSQQILHQRDAQIAGQLERMDADLSVMVTAFQGTAVLTVVSRYHDPGVPYQTVFSTLV
jgi:hypothetical protein